MLRLCPQMIISQIDSDFNVLKILIIQNKKLNKAQGVKMPSLSIAVGIFQIQKEYQEIPLAPSVPGCKSNDHQVNDDHCYHFPVMIFV